MFDNPTNYDFQSEQFLRRYRVTHLRTKANQPISLSNYDRHGMVNLSHDPVKPLDRFKIPPWFLYFCVFTFIAFVTVKTSQDKGLNVE